LKTQTALFHKLMPMWGASQMGFRASSSLLAYLFQNTVLSHGSTVHSLQKLTISSTSILHEHYLCRSSARRARLSIWALLTHRI